MTPYAFVIKADICYSTSLQTVETCENGYLVCRDGRCAGVFPHLPKEYRDLPLIDCTGCLAVPGLVDLHVHAPQYTFRGLGMDLELLDWLNTPSLRRAGTMTPTMPTGPTRHLSMI